MRLTNFLIAAGALCLWPQATRGSEPFAGLRGFEREYRQANTDNPDGIERLTVAAIRPKGNRERPYPLEGDKLVVNPPVFTWPMADYEFPKVFPTPFSDKALDDYARYDFQLSRKADFSDAVTAGNLRMPMYNNHAALAPGRWYWRYRVSGGQWSDTYGFDVSADTPKFESPTASEAEAMMPAAHPVIYLPTAQGKRTADRRALLKLMRAKARKAFEKPVADYAVKGEEIPATASESEREQILKFRLRYELEPMCDAIHSLLNVYRTEGNEAYLDKAVELARYVATKDPAQVFRRSDFAGARSMSALAEVFDTAPDRLSPEDAARFEEYIMTVGRRLMSHCMEENVGSADGILMAHFFQHTFCDLFNTASIMRLHNREAGDWFAMLYDIWLSRSPGGGFLDDGAWPNGNMAYIHVNMGSMVKNFVLFKRLFGINTLSHPWYANCADALGLLMPANSIGDGFGDGSDHGAMNNQRPDFAYILGVELDNPFAVAYARQAKGLSKNEPYVFTKSNFTEYRLAENIGEREASGDYDVPHAAVFPSTGMAVMHTSPTEAAENLFLSFRSSPFGVGSHGLAEQNSFNISYGGKPVFYPTGYKITTSDRHYLLCHKHSRARNTLLVDGKTQAYSHGAYGWVGRFLDGENISYAMGDASHAYVPFDISAINWQTVLEQADAYKSEEGFIIKPEDNPRVKKFRRHVAMLRPGIVVVYDDLEADKAVTWTFQLNGRERSNMSMDGTSVVANTDNCTARADLFGPSALRTTFSDTCRVKPVDWLNPQRGRKAMEFEANHYNASFENPAKSRAMRFLAVIRVVPGEGAVVEKVAPAADGSISIDGYNITAELDPAKDARLEIAHKASRETLLVGPSNGAKYASGRKYTHSSLLSLPGGELRESADNLPVMAVKER